MAQYRSHRKLGWQRALNAFLTSRWPGLLVAVIALFWRAGWEVNGVSTSGLIGAAVVFAMLHTETGRELLFLGWVTSIAVLSLSLLLLEFQWNVVAALLFVLAVGASWLVDWQRIIRRRNASAGFSHP